MCLSIKPKARIKIAPKDKICYKVYNKYHTYNNHFLVSPYQLTRFPYKSLPITIRSNIQPTATVRSSSYADVNIGLHSFRYLKDAIMEAKKWNKRIINSLGCANFTIFKCIIPKETHYWAGTFTNLGKLMPSYCSERLIIQEEIPI